MGYTVMETDINDYLNYDSFKYYLNVTSVRQR